MTKLTKAALQTAWTTGRCHGHGRSVPGEGNYDDLFDSVVLTDGTNAAESMLLDEQSTTPETPTVNVQARYYLKGDKFIIMFNDGGTIRYKYLLLSGTGVTWVHTTSAP